MKTNRLLALFLFALTACAPPTGNDVAEEIMMMSQGTLGKAVPLKLSASLKSGSLTEASSFWTMLGWVPVNATICKKDVPEDWTNVEAFLFQGFSSDAKSDQIYNLRICANQLSGPKRIGAIGLLVSSSKADGIKP